MNKNLLKDIINKLQKLGCDESDVFFSKVETVNSSCRLGKIEKTEKSLVSEIGIRAIINKRQSIVSTTNLEKKNINNLIDKAYQMAKVVPKNKFCGLADPKDLRKAKYFKLHKNIRDIGINMKRIFNEGIIFNDDNLESNLYINMKLFESEEKSTLFFLYLTKVLKRFKEKENR